jgi:hypothetical protein
MQNKKGEHEKSSRYNFVPKNNKGQDLSTSTIILIILGIAVLVILIIGFTTGWSFFKNLISPTNVDATIQDCASACETSQSYSFCSGERTLRVNEEKFSVKTSCYILANVASFSKYGIQKCPSIDCSVTCEQLSIDGKKGTPAASVEGAKYNLTPLAANPAEGQSCIIN